MTSIFHRFIEVAANRHPEATNFPEFAYMEHDIRKSYKQLKDNKGVPRPCEDFVDFWKEVGKEGKEEQVAMYFRWIELLERAKKGQQIRELVDRQAEMYVKKSLIGKWQRRKVRLTGLTMQIFSKNLREYPLRCFCIRKSKKKEHFSLVMEVVMQLDQSKYKSFHLGTNNIIQFQEWYRDVEGRIEIARVQYFIEVIRIDRAGGVKKEQDKMEKKEVNEERLNTNDIRVRNRTITEMVIDKELKEIEDGEELEAIEESEIMEILEEEIHPNIFHRLFPSYDLENFTQNPVNGELLQIDKHHRLYESNGKLKIFLTINHNISSVFRAISQSHKYWNPEIDVFAIKNKISSQNSVLAYQKDKSRGFLYRQRDYLFLRHCFTTQYEDQRTKIFMVEKSIDSIHTPPFMTVARGDKELIWCIIGESDQKESLLIVEGLIKGGGYMNSSEDKETTIRNFKKLLQLQNYLKQAQFTRNNQEGLLFRQNWTVSIKEESEQQFYSPKQFAENEEEADEVDKEKEGSLEIKKQKQQEQFDEFIRHTTQQNLEDCIETDRTVNFSCQQLRLEYKPPEFASDRSVIIPTGYLKARHRVNPKSKDKERLAEVIRGHHLWKGQWAVNEAGGLNYVDEEKMRQQKKVLTFIIKRIGKSILSGKGILNISLPVDIFCRQSNIQRAAMSFGYCPMFLQRVAHTDDPLEQLKGIVSVCMGSSLIYLTMQKPFNPILGETYQAWIDGCPVYFQQISHHPPIAAYYMIGRGYTISGSMEAKMDISINSGTGINEGIYTVKFDNGRTFYFVTPPGQISGLTYGERKLCLVRQTYFWNVEEGIFLEVSYNPLSKQRGFFGGGGKSLVGEQRLSDYFQGTVRRYKPDDLREFLTPKKSDSRKIMTIPRGSPNYPILGQAEKIHGRWTKYVYYGEEKLFDADRDRYSACIDDKNPLPSHSNFREDVVYRRLNNFVLSQEFKEILQVKQRKDRKLREENKKKNR